MPTIMPQGEMLRQAVRWIAEQRTQGATNLSQLVEKASVQYNLSPLDQDNLLRLLKEEKTGEQGAA